MNQVQLTFPLGTHFLPYSPTSGPSPVMIHSHPFQVQQVNLHSQVLNVWEFSCAAWSIVPLNQTGFAGQNSSGGFSPQGGPTAPITSHVAPQTPTGPIAQFNSGNFISQQGGFSTPNSGNYFSQQGGSTAPITSYMAPQTHTGPAAQLNGGNFHPQQGSVGPVASQAVHKLQPDQVCSTTVMFLATISTTGPNTSMGSHQALSSSTGALSLVAQPPKDKLSQVSSLG
ncbi:clathrin interactor EPSIN 2-like [Prunus yedoensis var. nudiflora]|uniref:Clathrin interactor EPSIN 2-like n=1 Tax=Prunus yedoensis var. nudiflora TaxID=2094558 RepID=A0A314YYL3_PRUYE|nr:clathrin interactor EPSIN 2-like [Prunus yedoensis var. nudiflora]